jgi:hypothetical protein
MKDLGDVSTYLGMNVEQVNNTAQLTQDSYIQRMVSRFELAEAKPMATPLPAGVQLLKADQPSTDEERQSMASTPYRALIGSLLYAARGARPDVAYAVAALSKHNQTPGPKHWSYATRVLSYLKGTPTKGIEFSRKQSYDEKLCVEIFSDSGWGSNTEDRKSISGFVVCLNGMPVSWSSRTHKSTALSSCEAEFLALSEATREAVWLYNFLTELDVGFVQPITIRVDNQSAIKLAENPVAHQRSKHIDVRYFRIHEEVAKGKIKIVYVPTDENLADVLTKSPSIEAFSNSVGKLLS